MLKYNPFLKRLFDIVFSLFVLVLLSPAYLTIAILVKITTPGPIFYSSRRIGQKFKPISCLKFRTMRTDADEVLSKLLQDNPDLQKEWETYQKLKTDPRVTQLGRFLRKTSLDELPQFLNILVGDLSVVGPRPFDQKQVDQFLKDKAPKILAIKPGLTGLWQTSGRNTLTMNQRLVLEEFYVENSSFMLDMRLILKTIPVFLIPKGAF